MYRNEPWMADITGYGDFNGSPPCKRGGVSRYETFAAQYRYRPYARSDVDHGTLQTETYLWQRHSLVISAATRREPGGRVEYPSHMQVYVTQMETYIPRMQPTGP